MRPIKPRAIAVLLLLPTYPLTAQDRYPSKFSPTVAEHPAVRDALAFIDDNFGHQVEEWMRITEIPAKSGHEARRAGYVRQQFGALGLEVETDSVGNVVARRRGAGDGPTIVFAAHMDTVHPMDTDVTVTRRNGQLFAPGVFDNSASVTNMLQAARALANANVKTKGDVIFIGTVQEELGLIGMSHWLDENPGVADMLVALDGGLGPVYYGARGIYWSRMVFSGEGSHTAFSRGKPHPTRAAARCILDIYNIPLPAPEDPVGAVYNVGMIEGGHVVNAIPERVWFTVDLRTDDPALLAELDIEILRRCEAAAENESVRFVRQWISREEAGGRPEQLADRRAHPLVQTAVDILKFLDFDFGEGPETRPSGSTDSNAGVVRGIPSVSVGRARGGDQHTLREWADIESAQIGTKQIILLAASLAELER